MAVVRLRHSWVIKYSPPLETALRFLTKAIRRHGVPETITIDGSEANAAAITRDNGRMAPIL